MAGNRQQSIKKVHVYLRSLNLEKESFFLKHFIKIKEKNNNTLNLNQSLNIIIYQTYLTDNIYIYIYIPKT